MKRKILAIALLALVILTVSTACSSDVEAEPSRFTYEKAEGVPGGLGYIVTDTVTGVQYLYIDHGYDGGMVKLEPMPELEPEPDPEPTPEPSPEPTGCIIYEHPYAAEAEYIAKTIWGEARGCSTTEQAAVVWCILNRVENPDPYFPDDIISVIVQENQFSGYDPDHPVLKEHYDLALNVIDLWLKEDGFGIVAGRVLPKDYCWFLGNGKTNTYRNAYEAPYDTWDWSLASPYE